MKFVNSLKNIAPIRLVLLIAILLCTLGAVAYFVFGFGSNKVITDNLAGKATETCANTSLKNGASGKCVTQSQLLINSYIAYQTTQKPQVPAPIEVSGTYDTATQAAAKYLQTEQGIAATGVMDATTWSNVCAWAASIGQNKAEGIGSPVKMEYAQRISETCNQAKSSVAS